MLLGNFPLVISRDFDETEDLGRRFFNYHQISLLQTNRSFYYRINAASLGNVALAYAEYNSNIDFNVGEQDDAYFAVIRWNGMDDIRVGHQRFAMPANSFAFLPPRQSLRVISQAGARGIAVRFERQLLEIELSALKGEPCHEQIPCCPAMTFSNDFARTFARMVRFLAVEINRPKSQLIGQSSVATHASRALTALILDGLPGLASMRESAHRQSGSDSQLRRVEEYIRGHLEQPLSLGDLAAIAGVSASTLHELFRRHRQCAPMQFVRQLRLEAVHRDLMSGMPFSSVTAVAYRWGFVHLGRFADHYRRKFGESPSTTLKKNRP